MGFKNENRNISVLNQMEVKGDLDKAISEILEKMKNLEHYYQI